VKTALVTGASRGIGRGIALSLARQGFGLTVTSRTTSDLEALAIELREAGSPQVAQRAADMADRDSLSALVGLHETTYGTMSALVVNAGMGTAGPVASFKVGRLDKTLEVNFTSAFVLIQAALPLLRGWAESDPETGSKIIGLSSITGAYAEAGMAVYGASKAALLSLIEAVNLEESDKGVTATAIAPAFVETDMTAWATDEVPADTMIRVSDVVRVVEMVVGLSRNASITRIVMARSGTSGYTP
jgi:3-oxoacyl-[acyl-carrier protein] reductase